MNFTLSRIENCPVPKLRKGRKMGAQLIVDRQVVVCNRCIWYFFGGGDDMALSDNIARLRKENKLSQEQLAELVGVSRQAVSKWEKDIARPSMENTIRLAEIFRVSVGALTGTEISSGEGGTQESISKYYVTNQAYVWLAGVQRLTVRLLNPLLFVLYLETWQRLYELAYIGQVRRNLPLLLLCGAALLVFLAEYAVSWRMAVKHKVIRYGENLEVTEQGMVVFDSMYRQKEEILWRDVKHVRQSRKYFFLSLSGRRYLPLRKEDITESQMKLLTAREKHIWNVTYVRIPVAIIWIAVTICGFCAVGSCMTSLNGALAWKIEEWKSTKTVKLEQTNLYETDMNEILNAMSKKIELMPNLTTDRLTVQFQPDGAITELEGTIYGYDQDYKLRASYVLYYDARSGKLKVHVQDWSGISKDEQREYDLKNDIKYLCRMTRLIDFEEATADWSEEAYGILYKGYASWGYNPEGVRYLDEDGNIMAAGSIASEEIKGQSLSVYCVGKTDAITPKRFVYREVER